MLIKRDEILVDRYSSILSHSDLIFFSPSTLYLILCALFLTSCNDFFGKKTDYTFIAQPKSETSAVAYVPLLPSFTDPDIQDPVDIIVGYDKLIYVADAATQKIVCFDQIGTRIGSYYVPGLKAIAQDRRLDILAIGSLDTLIGTRTLRLATVYRLELKNSIFGISQAAIKKKIIHPLYVLTGSSPTSGDTSVKFNGIATLADNSYYVTRTGKDQNPNKFIGPDDAILLFDKDDKITAIDRFVTVNTQSGPDANFFTKPGQITSFAQPPQSDNINTSGNFFVILNDPTTFFRIKYVNYNKSDNGNSFSFNILPQDSDTSKSNGGVLYQSNRYLNPTDITISGDGKNYIFMTDTSKDSVYQFQTNGYEGVIPPPYFTSTKYIKVSFGGTGTGPMQFNQPKAVAHFYDTRKNPDRSGFVGDAILLVADAGNKRILRFKLTTDLNQ